MVGPSSGKGTEERAPGLPAGGAGRSLGEQFYDCKTHPTLRQRQDYLLTHVRLTLVPSFEN